MEDTFRVRVDKVFGALGGTAPSSVGVSPSLWSLTDEEIERREWNRNKEEAEAEAGEEGGESGPSVGRIKLESDLRDLSDEEEEQEQDDAIDGDNKKRRRTSITSAETGVEEYLDVQSNIGRDCTLDYEEEEDQYDKAAVGTEETGDRLYMKDVKFADYGIIHENEYGELPNTFQTVIRDPRANHDAARIRLKEDAEAAGNFDTLQLSDNSAVTTVKTGDIERGEVDSDNPKPILKKRENLMDSRSQKRVRFMFDPTSNAQIHEDQQLPGASDLALEPRARDDCEVPKQESDLCPYSSGIPDYLRNPSKYTRYTFDSSDNTDDQSNRTAYMDFFNSLRKRNTNSSQDETSVEIPKSIVFTPRRKPEDYSIAKRSESEHDTGDNLKKNNWSAVIAADNSEESEISAMEEDEPSLAVDEGRSSQKPGRKYRTRTTDVNVNDTTSNCNPDCTLN